MVLHIFGKNGAFQTQVMTPGDPRTENVQNHTVPTPVWDRYYTYRMEWTPNELNFYVDGKLIRSETDRAIYGKLLDPARAEPMALRISLWAGDFPWSGAFDSTMTPAHIDVNWAQVYDYTPGAGPGGSNFTSRWRDEFNSIDYSRWYFANWTFEYAVNDYSAGNYRTKNGYYQAYLTRWENEGKQFGDPMVDDGLLMPPTDPIQVGPPKFPADPVTLPARIFANAPTAYYNQTPGNSGEPLCSGTDLDAEASADDIGGGCNLGWSQEGNWEEYTIVSPTDAIYDISARVADGEGFSASFQLLLDGAPISDPLVIPGVYSQYQAFQNLMVPSVAIGAGSHTLRVVHLSRGLNLKSLNIETSPASPAPESYVLPGAVLVPGTALAQQYSNSYDLTPGNLSGAGRAGDVDLENTTDLHGGQAATSTEVGEWVEYSVYSAQERDYLLALRLASQASPANVRVSIDGIALADLAAAPGLGSQNYATVEIPSRIHLTTGFHTVRMTFLDAGVNFHWFSLLPAPALPSVPGKVTGLSAVPGDGSVNVSWSPVVSATAYKVYRILGGNPELRATLATNAFLDEGLANGYDYSYYIVATNEGGEGASSDTVIATPVFVPADAPTSLAAVSGDSQVALSWTPGANNTSFVVYRSVDNLNFIPLATPNSASYLDAAAINGTTYWYAVAGVSGGRTSSMTDAVQATPRGEAPAKVVGLAARAGDGKIVLSWTASAGATSYLVARGDVVTSTTSSSFQDEAVVNAQSYTYTVVASNTWGNAVPSDPVSATPSAAPQPQFSLSSGSYVGARSVAISASGADSILYSIDGGSTWVRYSGELSISSSTTIAAISHLDLATSTASADYVIQPVPAPAFAPASGTYTGAQSVSISAAGTDSIQYSLDGQAWIRYNGPISVTSSGAFQARSFVGTIASSIVGATYTIGYPPAAVVGLSGLGGNGSASLSWAASSGATSYKVYRGGVLVSTTTTSNLNETGLVNGTVYSYSVVASNTFGDATPSPLALVTPKAAPVVQFSLAAGTYTGVQTLALTAVGADSIQYSFDGTTWSRYSTPLTLSASRTVHARSHLGLASASGSATYTIGSVPAQVTGLVATAGNASVTLNWSPASGATSYKVYRGALLVTTTTTATTFRETGLVNGTVYSYTVVASNTFGNAPASASVTATPTAPVASVKVQYFAASTASSTNTLAPRFRLVNTGAASVNLSEITVRYWYTNEGAKPQSYTCDWAQIGSSNLVSTFRTVSGKVNADTYLELGFKTTAGSLAAGATTGEIQNRIYKSDWSNYTQTNDASFDATKTAYTDWNRVTVYRNGVLIWGVEP